MIHCSVSMPEDGNRAISAGIGGRLLSLIASDLEKNDSDPDCPLHEQGWGGLRWLSVPRIPQRHCSGKVAIVGHTPKTSGEVLDLGFLKCIDTFCHGGGWLTALEVETRRVFWPADLAGDYAATKRGKGQKQLFVPLSPAATGSLAWLLACLPAGNRAYEIWRLPEKLDV